jgi:hypothetical protein
VVTDKLSGSLFGPRGSPTAALPVTIVVPVLAAVCIAIVGLGELVFHFIWSNVAVIVVLISICSEFVQDSIGVGGGGRHAGHVSRRSNTVLLS